MTAPTRCPACRIGYLVLSPDAWTNYNTRPQRLWICVGNQGLCNYTRLEYLDE